LLLQIRGAVAEYERVLIAERMRRGRQLRLRSGTLLPWTTPPFGYRSAPDCPRDPTGVRIEPIEGVLVQELFVRYLEPQGSLLGLAKYLLDLRVPSPHGNPRWSAGPKDDKQARNVRTLGGGRMRAREELTTSTR
jgi:site-specific DNA recombinase